jgi:hypothetical protein
MKLTSQQRNRVSGSLEGWNLTFSHFLTQSCSIQRKNERLEGIHAPTVANCLLWAIAACNRGKSRLSAKSVGPNAECDAGVPMRHRLNRFNYLLLPCLALVWSSAANADDSKNKSGKDPAGTTLIMGQLRLLFDRWDKNKDGYLDPGELAKAFRGASARPHNGDGNVPSDKLAAKYPDYQFLIQLDQNHDGKISLVEFEDWARSYAKVTKSSQKSASGRADSTSSGTKTDQAGQGGTKAEQQISKQMVANQKQQLHYLQEIEKQLKQQTKHAKH